MISSLPVWAARLRITILIVLSLVALWLVSEDPSRVVTAQAPSTYRNFEGPQIHPLSLTPDGTRLLAVNTPNATLSVFQLVSGSPVLTAEIPVGLEPVSVAVRNNREAWVANWMSDSVSIVDLAAGSVVRTIDVGDEPTDVLFAGLSNEKAFVCVSGGGTQTVASGGFSIQITGASGAVKVFPDASNPTQGAAQTIQISGKQPRALARSDDGSRVFVSVFESGNQTTIVSQSDVAANGGLPPPNPAMNPALPAAPNTGLIVNWNGSNWVDELNRSWNSVVPYTLADIDLFVINASGAPAVSAQVRSLGTHIGNMAFDPASQRLLVANLDDINQVRFEPNVRGRFQATRVSVLNAPAGTTPTLASVSDLNSFVDFNNPAGTDTERALSLAMPADIKRAGDGAFYIAATSSAKVGFLDSSGVVQGRIGVGNGPTGLAVDDARGRLYVLNRFDQTISIVDTASKAQTAVVPVGFNIEPASVRDGRRFLYDAASVSAHGTVSCASCHLNGHRDGQAWDLGNPLGSLDTVNTITGPAAAHPMKGPMTTQSLRGIIGNEPLHWRGDRAGLENFNGAFVSLLGGPRLLTDQEVTAFKAFVQSLTYPPNPNEPQTRPPANQEFFNNEPLDRNVATCASCHIVTGFKPGTNNTIIPKDLLQEPQAFKVPQFRGAYQKVGMDKSAGEKLAGFGFAHDGTFDTLFNFQKAPQFDFTSAHDPAGSTVTSDLWRRTMETMMLQLDTGTAPCVGMMTTAAADNKTSGAVTSRISLLSSQSVLGNCDLVVRGIYGGRLRGFVQVASGVFQPDSRSESQVTTQQLLNAVGPGTELTFMAVPPGEGNLFALDRDGNGVLNDDEPRSSVNISGQVVDASGAGVAGVTITLSGKQSATAVTNSSGQYSFNFISTTGTHVVTPSASGLSFSPPSRTFNDPSLNQSGLFVTSANVNVSNASQFFVAQHYADFLNRAPDSAGLQFWIGQIESCGSDQSCRDVRRINGSAAFFLSIEFKETGYLVYRTYKASFGDLPGKPVPITFAQLFADSERLDRNVIVNVGDWQTQIETNKKAFFLGWVQRLEFVARFPVGMAPASFVDALNANTGNSLTQSERDAIVSQLSANNSTNGRATAVRQVVENSTFSQREFNRAFVLMQYFGYLRRNPDEAPELNRNFDGFNFWLGKLNQFNGDFVGAEMVKAFISSGEYRGRFGP
jgi:YVTN family beta-propeller protein